MSKSLVDCHCHIDLYRDPSEVIKETERNGVYTIAVTNAPFVFQNTRELVSQSKYIRPAIGLHPELVESHADQIHLFNRSLNDTRYVGEVGLDYCSANSSVRSLQRSVFSKVLDRCASSKEEKVLTIHSRRATQDVIDAIGPNYRGKVILHWFTGSPKQAEKAAGFGMYFSVNPLMMGERSESIIRSIPHDRILTESDGPFAKIDKSSLRPLDVIKSVERLAVIWQVPTETAREKILSNFRQLLISKPLDRSSESQLDS